MTRRNGRPHACYAHAIELENFAELEKAGLARAARRAL